MMAMATTATIPIATMTVKELPMSFLGFSPDEETSLHHQRRVQGHIDRGARQRGESPTGKNPTSCLRDTSVQKPTREKRNKVSTPGLTVRVRISPIVR